MSRQQAGGGGRGGGGGGGASESGMPVRKKARKQPPRMDEDTMVALALSRSLLEQEKEERRIQEQLSRAGAGEFSLYLITFVPQQRKESLCIPNAVLFSALFPSEV